jgi:hypothetical protein
MKLEHGALRDAVSEFGGSIHVVRAAWDKNRNAILEPDKYALDVRSKNGGGRPSKMTGAQVRAAVGKVPCRYRHSLRKLAEKTGIPKSTLARHLKIDNDILQRGGLRGDHPPPPITGRGRWRGRQSTRPGQITPPEVRQAGRPPITCRTN